MLKSNPWRSSPVLLSSVSFLSSLKTLDRLMFVLFSKNTIFSYTNTTIPNICLKLLKTALIIPVASVVQHFPFENLLNFTWNTSFPFCMWFKSPFFFLLVLWWWYYNQMLYNNITQAMLLIPLHYPSVWLSQDESTFS